MNKQDVVLVMGAVLLGLGALFYGSASHSASIDVFTGRPTVHLAPSYNEMLRTRWAPRKVDNRDWIGDWQQIDLVPMRGYRIQWRNIEPRATRIPGRAENSQNNKNAGKWHISPDQH